MARFCYRRIRNYKYQLREDFEIDLGREFGAETLGNEFIRITPGGSLKIRTMYAWDGPSGPVPDTQANLKASLVHDALYQLMREGRLPFELRDWADQLFRELCIRGGVWPSIAAMYYRGLKWFGAKNARPRENATAPTICLEA